MSQHQGAKRTASPFKTVANMIVSTKKTKLFIPPHQSSKQKTK